MGEKGHMYMYGWDSSLFTWNYLNIVNELHPNTKCYQKKKKKLVEIRMKMSLDRRNLTREGLLSCRFSPEGTQKSMQKKELQRNEPWNACMNLN